MIYVFNKNKMISYMVASFIVLMLFTFSTSLTTDKDVRLMEISANSVNEKTSNSFNKIENNLINHWKIKKKLEKLTFYVDKTKKR